MTFFRSTLAACACLVATGIAAQAQAPYSPYPSYAYRYSPATVYPPSWSYDPYASGLGPCPQHRPGDPPCSVTLKPTYGQPNFWPTR